MSIYDIATAWILVGVTVWVFHVVYIWGQASAWMKKLIVSLDSFLICVSWWPTILISTITTWRTKIK